MLLPVTALTLAALWPAYTCVDPTMRVQGPLTCHELRLALIRNDYQVLWPTV